MQGDQVRALKIISRAKGWDPDRIFDPKSREYGESIENFNKEPQIFVNQAGTGELPDGTPDTFPRAMEAPLTERVTFSTPDTGREDEGAHRTGTMPAGGFPTPTLGRTTGADPHVGRPGAR